MKLITVKQAAEMLGMSVSRFYSKTKSEAGFPQIVKISEGMARVIGEESEAYVERKISEFRDNPTKRSSASAAATASVKARAKKPDGEPVAT